MFGLRQAKEQVESEGVYVGGWSLENAFTPPKKNGQRATDQDVVEHVAVVGDWTQEEERALVRKMDMRVLFPCCILYFLAYLDRANMGFVGILQSGTKDNMLETLHLQGIQFNWAISVTYFAVTALLLPSNLIMKKVSGKIYFPIIMVLFGTIVCGMSAVKSDTGLIAARFFLGVPEAGVVPACIMYFSFWYKPSERALRIGIFHSANSLASGVGGFIAVGVDHLNGRAGLESWRWLFIVEGLMPIVMALPVYFLLLTFPETSSALSERERYIAINRFPRGATRRTDVTWDTRAFIDIMSRPSTYVFFVSYICLLIVAVALGTFLPIILKQFLQFDSHKANVYTSAIYLVAIAEYSVWSWHSDWTRERMWHYLLPVFGAIPCFAVWTHVSSNQSYGSIKPIALYGLAFLGNLVSISQPAALAYRSSTLYGAAEQAVGGATAVAALSIASIISPQIFPTPQKPWYLPGFSTCCATLAFTVIGYASLPLWLLAEARWRKRKTGHAMPFRALEDAAHAMVSETTRIAEQEQRLREEKGLPADIEIAKIEDVKKVQPEAEK
ncbi:uncharacterized protein PV09_02919 [Verruconis gallopava]|uniref:Major facilitator superfamily (MFS) profile domain-containing protein n=1 Tax=Verruconis gallopava TaxID=253628 RepID=A0A0D2AHX6_9PEZI|nr:uncharacterized protein PV09_02919 [Verruconis gallopava]KIW06483.1 hypothetical protein PV09_02919 [Verruconis gallopava]